MASKSKQYRLIMVTRSHKTDNELFYSRRRFSSEIELYKSFKQYSIRTNNIARRVLGFKTPTMLKYQVMILFEYNMGGAL